MPAKDCPHCQGTGWKAIESAGVRRMARCECRRAEQSESLLSRARIPRRYEHCAFENFDILKDSRTGQFNSSLEEAKIRSQKLVDEYPIDSGLLFTGPTGVGKTHLAVAALRGLMQRKATGCLFYDFTKLLKDIRASYNPVSGTSELRVLEPVLSAEALLLDDMTASDPTDWVRETLAYIINCRYNDKKITLITTTLPLEPAPRSKEVRAPSGEVIPSFDRSLAQLSPTLTSRLYEMCRVIEMNSADYRKTIKQTVIKYT